MTNSAQNLLGKRIADPTQCATCAIRRLALFHGVPEDQLDWTQQFRSAQLELPEKHMLAHEGQHFESLYTLYSGWVLVSKTLPSGRRQIVRVALPGDLLGYQKNMEGPSEVTLQAITPVVVCAFPRDKFCDYLKGRPDLIGSLNRMHAHYMSVCFEYLIGLGQKTARERVGMLLLDLWFRAKELGSMVDFSEASGISLPLSQEDMGDVLGISAVHVNRTLRELRDESLIELDHRQLRVLDEDTLSGECGFDPQALLSRYSIMA